MRITTILILALIIIGVVVIAAYGLDLSKKEDRNAFAKTYTGYLIQVAQNTKELAKHAVHQEWRIKEKQDDINSTKVNE